MQTVARGELSNFARTVLTALKSSEGRATLLTLAGDLGAGKTTFVQALAKELGVTETVQSPTYVLMKSYATTHLRFKKLVHLDLYRLGKAEEFATLQPESFLGDTDALVCIEWPERAGDLLPKPDASLRFSADGAKEGERYIEVA